ncbi:MAG: hypothetical protein WCV59_02110 [Parcubacteria group bacterium]|jgi:hypothetical protein
MNEWPIREQSKTIENKLGTNESRRLALIKTFEENEMKIRDLIENGEKHYISDEQLAINEDIQRWFPEANEQIKKTIQQEMIVMDKSGNLARNNKNILHQLAEINKDNKSSEFVLSEIKKDENFFFKYSEDCLEIFKKGDAFKTSKDIIDYISSKGLEKSEYFLYAYILTEIFQEINNAEEENRIKDLYERLEKDHHADIIMLSIMLKSAKAAGEKIDFEMIKNLKLERRVIGDNDENGQEIKLSEEEKEEMLKMVEKNYREVVFPDNPKAAEAVIGDFKKEMDDGLSGQIVYTLKFQDKLAAFCRFEKLNDEEVYAGSLNVDQEVNSLCIGKYFTGSVLPEMARQFRIKAITRVSNPAISMYEKQGLVIDRDNPFEKHGEQYYNMVMEKKKL